ncbi:MAG: maleylpyruvate isomerase N-terminal domain-containing protein [Acidobacteria bacterium]|nr:maleylpyruvate isomerase N-terminal domain-containing protein [Acidobacteriota bacterium]
MRPILCAHLIRAIDEELICLLSSLQPAEWDAQTIVPFWKVRDVAAHLLDTALRKLSAVRDGCFVETVEIRSSADVAALVHRLNREGVAVYRRLSPQLLIPMMREACAQSADFHESIDPFAPAVFGVSWAGEEQSLNWFDTARELTERWHHQQQIRLATNRPGILTPELYHPVLDCFARGLPHLFRDFEAEAGAEVILNVTGECGGRWFLARRGSGWTLVSETNGKAAARVTMPQELAWRLFTKGVDRETARAQVEIEGDRRLGERVLQLTAIVS